MRNEFCKELKDALDASGFTQKKAAEALHISEQTLCAYLHGRSTPDIQLFDQIVKMFGIDVTRIFDVPDYSIISDLDIVNMITKLDQDQKNLFRALLFYFKIVNSKLN